MRSCEKFVLAACREDTKNQRESTYTSFVLKGELWAAIRWITNRERGGVYHTRYIFSKTGEIILDVLQANHLEACPETDDIFRPYMGAPPFLVP